MLLQSIVVTEREFAHLVGSSQYSVFAVGIFQSLRMVPPYSCDVAGEGTKQSARRLSKLIARMQKTQSYVRDEG